LFNLINHETIGGFKMRQFVKASITVVALGVALAFAGTAVAGISNTKHNLGSSGINTNNQTTATGEICVFCHTPHGGDTGAAVPLWNKEISAVPGDYTMYDQLGTSTLDGGVTTIGSISIACLTCHDGTQAIDNIINAPGSGGFTPIGSGGPDGLDWAWVSGGGTGLTVDATGTFQGTAIANIGQDLQNDHPISVQYGGGGLSSTALSGTLRDGDFFAAQNNGNGADPIWWVDNTTMEDFGGGSTGGTLDKWDFKLYTRAPGATAKFSGNPEPFVECGSCHDPHFETTTFLRIDGDFNGLASTESNAGSKVCLTCHNK
jgi:hypothetical protein